MKDFMKMLAIAVILGLCLGMIPFALCEGESSELTEQPPEIQNFEEEAAPVPEVKETSASEGTKEPEAEATEEPTTETSTEEEVDDTQEQAGEATEETTTETSTEEETGDSQEQAGEAAEEPTTETPTEEQADDSQAVTDTQPDLASTTEIPDDVPLESDELTDAPEEPIPFKASVSLQCSGNGSFFYGDRVTLVAKIHDANADYRIRWEVNRHDGSGWRTIPGEDGTSYHFIITEEIANYEYRVVLVAAD